MAEVKETQEEKKPAKKRTTKKAAAETAEKAAADVVTELYTQEVEKAPEAEAAAVADGVTELDTQEQEVAPEPVERFCYMGPTLRKYGLIENMIYTGTATQFAALTEPAKTAYPEIGKLIFAAKDFQKIKQEKASGNNYISRLYNKIKQM